MLFLEIFGLFADEFLEACGGKFGSLFAGLFFGSEKSLIELLDFVGFAFRVGTHHPKRYRFGLCRGIGVGVDKGG